jgi:phosphoglycerate dehydrogenase-like enzyme
MMTETILVLQPVNEELQGIIRAELPPGFAVSFTQSTDPAHLAGKMPDAEYVVWWDEALTGSLLAAAPRLKLAHKWGVGVENIDMDVARSRNIQVARTTGGNAVPVAEFAIALMLAAGRRIVQAHNAMVEGRWAKNEVWRHSVLLSGKTVGIIGLGAIGTEVARRLPGFGCRILYHNRRSIGAEREAALGVAYRSVADMLPEVDLLCLTCPLTPETRNLIGAAELARMKPGSILVNVARGGIVVEADLVEALRSGHLAAAAIDVYDPEPPDPQNPLLHLPNVVVTPHCASTAFENSAKGIRHWLRNIVAVSQGQPLPDIDRVV